MDYVLKVIEIVDVFVAYETIIDNEGKGYTCCFVFV